LNFIGKDIISVNDMLRNEIDFILEKSEFIENMPVLEKSNLLKGKIIASLFFEPSTRTKDSFTTACYRLGGSITGFTDTSSTSLKKGETLFDTLKMYEIYSDVIVMRHNIEGSARFASECVDIPIINGGDGANQHPTQTLLDLYSIKKNQGKIDGLSIALAGDLKYGRTVHSLACALSLYKDITLYFISPESLKMPDFITELLKERNINFFECNEINDVIDKVDIFYMTRIQGERFPDKTEYEKVKGIYILEKNNLINVKENLKIMHPLPRIDEISKEIDNTPYAYYFEQAANGIPVRQALLSLLTGGIK